MKKIKDLLTLKEGLKKTIIDDKSVLYLFQKIIEREYGNKGLENTLMCKIKGTVLFINTRSSVWANEFWLNRENLRNKINKEAGSQAVREIRVKSGLGLAQYN